MPVSRWKGFKERGWPPPAPWACQLRHLFLLFSRSVEGAPDFGGGLGHRHGWWENDVVVWIIFVILAILVLVIIVLTVTHVRLRRRMERRYFTDSVSPSPVSSRPYSASPSRSSGFSDLDLAGVHAAPTLSGFFSKKTDSPLLDAQSSSSKSSQDRSSHIYDNVGAIMY